MGDDFFQRILIPYKRYFDFKGRSSRREYWLFVLLFIIVLILTIIAKEYTISDSIADQIITGLWSAFVLGTIIPGFAAAARRLHDGGNSAWWLLIYFVPLIGGIWLLILLLTPSQNGSNKWGPNPLNQKQELELDTLDSQFVVDREDDELL